MVRLMRSLLLIGLCLAAAVAAAEVKLDVDPDPIQANASAQLTFRITDADAGEPDFAPLEADFDILRRNRQTSVSWINGRSQRQTTWVLEVMPHRTGTIEIPALAFGALTSPARTVEVVATPGTRDPAAGTATGSDILLEVEASPRTPYVQEQVIYTVRLRRRVELSNPRFSPLNTSTDAIVKPLGDGRQFIETVDGISYETFEQRYAIFPQKSGPLRIDPLVLTTQIVSGKRSLFDPFAQTLQTRRVESNEVVLEVKPAPAAFPAGATWLPARRLRLHEEWEPDTDRIAAGEPLSRTLFLWADGLIAGQLPEIAPAAPPGIKVYPDQAQSNDQAAANGFTAVLQQKFAIIGSTPGAAEFGALSVPWWNTETDALEVATLPARQVAFEGASGNDAAATAVPDAAIASEDGDGRSADMTSASAAPTLRLWQRISAALAAAWLLTIVAWWWSRRAVAPGAVPLRPVATSERDAARTARASSALKQACAAHDADAAREALLDWSQGRAGAPCRNLREVVAVIATAALREAVIDLERALYGRQPAAWRGDALWTAFRLEPAVVPARMSEPAAPLPPLFKLGRG